MKEGSKEGRKEGSQGRERSQRRKEGSQGKIWCHGVMEVDWMRENSCGEDEIEEDRDGKPSK